MNLKMYIGDKLIDMETINLSQLNAPGYIASIRAQMEENYEDIIDLSKEEPKFFIDEVPSRMNAFDTAFKN